MGSVHTLNPNGGVIVQARIGRTDSKFSPPGYGLATLMKRPVRTRMRGVVGAGGEKPPATRLYYFFL